MYRTFILLVSLPKLRGREGSFPDRDFSLTLLLTETVDFFLAAGLWLGVTLAITSRSGVEVVCFLAVAKSDFNLCPEPMDKLSES